MSRVCVLLIAAMASLCGHQASAILNLTRESLRANPGQKVSGMCIVRGETFKGWFKDNNRITTTTTATVHVVSNGGKHELKFTQVRVSDGGTYECRGSSSKPKKMKLEVAYDLSKVDYQQHIKIGQTDTIKLGVDGYPTPKFTWKKGDKDPELSKLPRFTVLQDGSLRISNVKLDDQGNYTFSVNQDVYTEKKTIEVYAVEYPKIKPFSSPYKYLTENYPAYFVCEATGIPPPKYKWISPNGDEINTVGNHIKDGGYLNITKVSAIFQKGKYTCKAYIKIKEKEIAEDTASIEVKAVYVAPEIKPQGGDANLERGQRFVLECQASGTPTPTVEWKRGGEVDPRQQKLTARNRSTIIFSSIQVQDGGKYTCEARNSAVDSNGNNIVATMVKQINIKSPPFINIQASPRVVYSFLGNSAPTFVSCTFEGYPSPWVKMTFNGKLMSNATNTANVSVKTDAKKKFGDYLCYAKNDFGFKNQTVTLKQVGKPSEVRELKGTATCTAVTLTWKPPLKTGGLPINKYVLTYGTITRNIDGKTTSYTITDLKWDTGYNFILRATNKGEWGPVTRNEITTKKFCVPGRPVIYEPSITQLEIHTFKLKWRRPEYTGGDANIKYQIRYSDVSDDKEGPWKTFETKETEYEIKDLEPQKKYKFEVRAMNQAGESSPDERYYYTIGTGARASQSRLIASLFITLIVGILHLL